MTLSPIWVSEQPCRNRYASTEMPEPDSLESIRQLLEENRNRFLGIPKRIHWPIETEAVTPADAACCI